MPHEIVGVMQAACLAFLLIACVNLASLLLVRANERLHEIAVLATHVLRQAIVPTVIGIVIGVAGASSALQLMRRVNPADAVRSD